MNKFPISRPGHRHLLIPILYTLLAIVATWPLATHFTTHVPGNGIDDPALAWNLWWIKARLIDQLKLDIFQTDWMFNPIGINLAFYTLTPLNGLLSVPLQSSFDLITTSNLILLSSFVIGGYGTFLLVRHLLLVEGKTQCQNGLQSTFSMMHVDSAAFYAGVIYAFASSKLFYASLGQFNIAGSHWIPFCILYILRMNNCLHTKNRVGSGPIWRETFLAALFLTFQAWAELTYASFLIIFTGLYFCWQTGAIFWMNQRKRWPQLRSLLAAHIALAGLFVLGISPFLWAMIPDLLREGDFFGRGGGFADIFSADAMGYLFPTILHPLFGDWVAGLPFQKDLAQQIFIGYSPILLILFGLILMRRRGRRVPLFWLFSLFFFWLLTLGPQLRWGGKAMPIPGPFALVSLLPFFNGNRYPSRYSVMVMISVAVLAGYALFWFLGRWSVMQDSASEERASSAKPGVPGITQWREGALIALLIGLFFFEHASIPLPLNQSTTPSIYQQLATLPNGGTLLELPTGWRNGARVMGLSDKLLMMQQWYQSVHRRPRLGGNTSRNPRYKFQYFLQAPLIGDLIALMNGDVEYVAPVVDARLDEMIARNREQAPAILDLLDVAYVAVHVEKSSQALLRFIDEALPLTLIEEWQGSDWAGEASTIRLYRVAPRAAPAAWAIDLASDAGRIHLAEGWSVLSGGTVRYAVRAQTELLLDIPTSGGRLELMLYGPAQNVELWLNDQPLGEFSLPSAAGEGPLSIEIPADLAVEAIDHLRFVWRGEGIDLETFARAQMADRRGWPIGNTREFLAADGQKPANVEHIVARSAGKDVGDFAQIFVNGEDASLNDPGYNLIAIDRGGAILEAISFDTLTDVTASAAMATWLRSWPQGTIIAGAVRDTADGDFDGFRNLGADAITALNEIGVAGDLRRKFRWSHAFVGVVGAPAGTATESMDLLQPTTAIVGPAIIGKKVFGAVGWLRFSANE